MTTTLIAAIGVSPRLLTTVPSCRLDDQQPFNQRFIGAPGGA